MKQALAIKKEKLYYYENGREKPGASPPLRGDVSRICGNVDDCELTEAERAFGVRVENLVL